MRELAIDVFSDIACPWCYIGKRRLEAALRELEHRDAVRVVWRAYELDAAAPTASSSPVDYVRRIAEKKRCSSAQAHAMIRHITEIGAAEGLDLRFDRIKPGNTFDAHRLIAFGRAHGRGVDLTERVFHAYMTEGLSLGDREVLAGLAADVGLPIEDARAVLATGAFTDEVRGDERLAAEIGIQGVPFFVVDERFAISGAQPAEVFFRAFERAWREPPLSSRDAARA